ncbi:MAG: selenide, water dikinase SelD [Planctomycetes bacterium]|nr:selenide, water dikinase SelD [Planctomycetota bacterium]
MPQGSLGQVLAKLQPVDDPRLLAGTSGYEDAGVFQVDAHRALVQTVDFFPPIVDDPRWFGRIAAANALSDVFAMGGVPLTALNLVGWPTDLDVAWLGEIMAGGDEKVREAGAVLCGGHSVTNGSILYGLSVTGEVDPGRFWRNSGAHEGDLLMLTKPLGIGIAASAMKKGVLTDPELHLAALEQMAQLNRLAAELVADLRVHGATDVTGFGLMGHAHEMAVGAKLTLEIESAAVPLFPGTLDLARAGLVSGAAKRGRKHISGQFAADGVDDLLLSVLFDAETSGGLLLAIESADAALAERRCRDNGVSAVIIGGFAAVEEVAVRVS